MKIICIGRNYVKHAEELNNEVPERPLFFMKPETALIRSRLPFYYPDFSQNIHYEAELVLRICKLGKRIQKRFAPTYYDAVGVGLDFTARDVQEECKKKGHPWEIAKAFDGSAVVSEFVPVSELADPGDIRFSLKKNDTIVQEGRSTHMIHGFDDLIAYVSKFVTLKIGDMLFTGTPAGVGPVKIGDKLELLLEGKSMLTLPIK